MSSGPGTTGKSPLHAEEAIEEISGLLEIEDGPSAVGAAADAHRREAEADAVDVNMETPPPATPAPPRSPAGAAAAESAEPASNMAYEDLLEKLVLPAGGGAAAESEPASMTETPRPTEAAASASAWRFPAAPALVDSGDERTVVTQNPLIAEEQEAAREAFAASQQTPTAISDSTYQAAAASTAYAEPAPVTYAEPAQVIAPSAYTTPVFPPVAAAPAPVVQQPRSAALPTNPGRVHMSYPMLGGIVLTALIVGGLIVRYMAPQSHGSGAPASASVVAQPAPAAPKPEVVPTAAPAPAVAAEPEKAAPAVEPEKAAPAAAEPEKAAPAAEPEKATAPAPEPEKAAAPAPEATAEAEPAEAAPKPASKPRPHRASASKPAAAPKASKPKPSKPAGGKKSGGWSDPFAQ